MSLINVWVSFSSTEIEALTAMSGLILIGFVMIANEIKEKK
jgi:hypothetical protein